MQYHVAASIFAFLAATSQARHLVLTASSNAAIDVQDAKAIRTVAENQRKHVEADAEHLEWLAGREELHSQKEEPRVEEELDDARAIHFISENPNEARAADEAADAEQLRKVANIEEQDLLKEDDDAVRMLGDAKAITATSLEEYRSMMADADKLASQKTQNAGKDAEAIRTLAQEKAENLEFLADREELDAMKKKAQVAEELEDAKAIDFVVSRDHSDPRALDEAADAEQLRQVAKIEEERATNENNDAVRMEREATAINSSSLKEYRSMTADAEKLTSQNAGKDAKAIRTYAEQKAKNLEFLADREELDSQEKKAQVAEELEDAKAIDFVSEDPSDTRAADEAADAEQLRQVAKIEEQRATDENNDAVRMQREATAINQTSLEESHSMTADAEKLTSQKTQNAGKDAKATRTVAEEKADAKHLESLADREELDAQKKKTEVEEELDDAKAIDFVSKNHSDARAADEAADAEQLRQVANIEEQQVVKENNDAVRMEQDATAINATSIDESHSMTADAKKLTSQSSPKAGKDAKAIRTLAEEKADAKHLESLADREELDAQKEKTKVKEELDDAKAITFISKNHSDARAADEAADAEQLRQVANIEEQQEVKENDDAVRMQQDATAINATSIEESKKSSNKLRGSEGKQ